MYNLSFLCNRKNLKRKYQNHKHNYFIDSWIVDFPLYFSIISTMSRYIPKNHTESGLTRARNWEIRGIGNILRWNQTVTCEFQPESRHSSTLCSLQLWMQFWKDTELRTWFSHFLAACPWENSSTLFQQPQPPYFLHGDIGGTHPPCGCWLSRGRNGDTVY